MYLLLPTCGCVVVWCMVNLTLEPATTANNSTAGIWMLQEPRGLSDRQKNSRGMCVEAYGITGGPKLWQHRHDDHVRQHPHLANLYPPASTARQFP